MTLSIRNHALFPDDDNALPRPGTPEQDELIADEESIGDESYLDTIRTFDPQAELIYGEVARNALAILGATGVGRELRVLDLGAGIGLEAHALLQHDVVLKELTLSDYSPKVLETGRALLAKSPNAHKVKNLTLLPLDLLASSITDHVRTKYDLVMTCNAFMHFPKEDHERIFADVHRVLADGGVFLFQSHLRILERDWKQSIIGAMQKRMAEQGQTPEQIDRAGRHLARFHHFHPGYEVLNWMEKAGFGYFECVYRSRMIGIFAGVK